MGSNQVSAGTDQESVHLEFLPTVGSGSSPQSPSLWLDIEGGSVQILTWNPQSPFELPGLEWGPGDSLGPLPMVKNTAVKNH